MVAPPILLAIDASGDRSVVGLQLSTGEAFEEATDASRKHGRDLLPQIRTLLRRAGLRPADLECLGVGLGPGSYTGLRIGLTAARTLAYAVGARLVGFDSLGAVARNAPEGASRVVVVGDALRGDVYTIEFARASTGGALIAQGPSRLEPLALWAARLESGVCVLGPGLKSAVVREALAAHDHPFDDPDAAIHRPSARGIVAEALAAFGGPAVDPSLLEPNYLRRSAAEDQWDAASRR